MPPRCKFTREEIIDAALAVTREQGFSNLTARSLAARLGTSPKPIFGFFPSMEQLQFQVLTAADKLYQSYTREDMARGEYPPYKASGMAYIRFAKEEKELFKLLFMRDRTGETIEDNRDELQPIIRIIRQNLNISEDDAYLFHLELWLYVHGIATMIASGFLDWDMDFVSRALTDAYLGMKYRYTEK